MPSIKELRNYIYIPKEEKQSLYVRINAFLGVYTGKILLYTPITANQVTFLMGFVSIIAAIFFSFGKFWYSIVGLILVFLHIHLDNVDGLIARYRNATSIKGVFADSIVHSVTGPLVFFGLTLGVFRNTNNMWFLIFGILAAIFIFLCPSVQEKKYQVLIMKLKEYANGEKLDELKNKKIEKINTETGINAKFIFLKHIVKKTMNYLIFTFVPLVLIFSIIFDFTHWVLVFYGIVLPIKWVIILFYEWKIGYEPLEYLFRPYKPR